jgi:hypothetical protein
MWNSIINMIINSALGALKVFVPVMTGELKTMISKFLLELKKKADATPNQFDDILVSFLCDLFDVKG